MAVNPLHNRSIVGTKRAGRRLSGFTGSLDGRYYPNYLSENALFLNTVDLYLAPDKVVLDAGCGNGSYRYEMKDRVQRLVGYDVVATAVDNPNVHQGVVGDLEAMPFPDSHFDLVFSRYVVEHLNDPFRVFAEMARVMKPGALLVVLTPNRFHYVPIVSSLTPHWLHVAVAAMRGNRAEDTFPTKYRANTAGALRRLCTDAGLRVDDIQRMEARPNYLIMSPLTYAAGIAYERIVNRYEFLAPLRSSIVLVARKPQPFS